MKVNSRPAACLVSFLLQGKNVLLEQPKKSGNKVISHVLTSHAGDLYIHCLGNNRCPLEDPPSISEGCGGRVTDYRINVLASFVCPLGVKISDEVGIDDISLDISDEDITNALPSLPDIFMNSCLIPTLASYLRNDSVLDMARHVPVYRAVLGFVRCIAVSRNLVPLLHPGQHNTKNTSKDDTSSLCSLLTKMKLCVDTYGSRLRSSEKVEDSKKKIKVETTPSSAATKTEDLENESLSLLIPDVQTTSMLVHKAVDRYRWEHLKIDGSSTDGDAHGQGADEELLSTEEKYSFVMMPLQFDTFSVVTEGADGKINFTIPYHFSSSVKSATSSGQRTNAGRARRLAQEIASLSTSLPLSYSSSVFVRCDEERLDIMKVLMTGPADTPYANGCFEFDVYFPLDYPSNPMHISFETTGNHRIRFNPNLYNDGKVCLSILNTWHGRPEEKWNSQTSSFLQVLVSIQSLILVPEPYFNEPGYERSRGTHSGTVNSREYDANIRQATVKWAMLEPLKNPCPCFKQVIERHFFLKKDEVLGQCDEWIGELETWSKEKRTMRSISHHLDSLRRHTTQLRDEIAKLSEDCLETPDDDTE
ncbi:baculoviral IAP repeat-containing 6-like [Paramuricea clavata]|uniref:Baculoviral IAP repeat-containing 6-like n=1 Tax=Paramuricea clavata TaxID=317549 RepID=A0A6S7H942_PARCT|nr:baculoviral IAP repeat-containing 6-like [Paramuricea clavata]